MNRIKNRNYSTPGGTPNNYQASPNVTYTYGTAAPAIGQLTKVSTGIGPNTSTTEYLEFDILGRVKRSIQTTDGITYGDGTDESRWMTYDYNLSGALIEQQYPSGRKVTNVLDTNGDLATVQSKKNQNHSYWKYANHFSYNAAGAVTSMQLGNGRWESTQFNSRLQPTQIALGKIQNATDLLKLDYQYGDLQWNGTVDTQKNNGNVAKQTITVPSVGVTPGYIAVQNYDYDSLNRIQIASETLTPTSGTAENWVQDFRYDRYGNRTFHEPTTTTLPKECGTAPNFTVCPGVVPIVNPSVNSANNRLNGYSFDDAGNTTRDAENRKFTYDAENKQVKVETLTGETVTGTIGEYWYDGDGKRIKKRGYTNNVLTQETIFVYDAVGKLIAEYSNDVASAQDAKVAYLTSDHLGSPRINTDINGNVTARHDYHPFGEEIESLTRVAGLGYAEDTIRKQFTGYERDNEINLDFAQARYYNNQHGRFTTTDPLLSSGRPPGPQTWNRYIYVLNNPLKYVDPNGLCEAPSGLKAGQVGICFEAFIAAKSVGVGGLGHGDNRGFAGNDPNATARVTVWSIVSTDANSVSWTHTNEVSPSVVGGGDATISGTATGPDGSQYRVDTGVNTDVSLQGTATTGVQVSNIQAKQGEAGFGAGVDVTLSIANGTNGGQQLGRDLQTTGTVMASTGNPVTGAIVTGAGKLGEALAPGGTIDGNVTLRITGNGNVQYVGGESRGYPSYAVYSYRVGADGKVQTTEHRRRVENKIEDLKKPMTPF